MSGYYLSNLIRPLAEDCIAGRLTTERLALPLEGAVAGFTLQDEHGEVVTGSPFALLVLPADQPEGDRRAPADILAAAQRLLERVSVPLFVVALPLTSPQTGEWIAAEAAAERLRALLGVAVYTDAEGTFIERYSSFLPFNANLLLFDAEGNAVDNFTPHSNTMLGWRARSNRP